MKQKIFLLLICTVLMIFSFLSNISIGYALENTSTNSYDEGSSYYLISYNGEEQQVEINDELTLILTGWGDESKLSVNGRVETVSNSTTVAINLSMTVSEQLNELVITENESIHYRIIASDSFNTEKIQPLQLNDQTTVVEQNENGTFIEEQKIVDEYGTVFENKGLNYYSTDKSNQKVVITKEEYESLNANTDTSSDVIITPEKETNSDVVPENDLSVVSEETSNPVTVKTTSESVQPVPKSTSNKPSVVYSTHVEDDGWLEFVSDGQLSGTVGAAKRLEAIKISLKNSPYSGGISYKTHVQDFGWLGEVSNEAISGTSGKAKRLEAIEINLTGEMAQHYDIYYRVHAEHYGWLDWAKNGQSSGTQGLSKRLEAIEIVLVEKNGAAPGPTNKPLVMDPSVTYSTHVQDYGWLTPVADGQLSGTSGKAKRMEALKISLKSAPYSGGISYKTHVQDYGWLDAVSNGALSGTSGESKRLEAIQINLTGEMAQHYDIYYRVHAEHYGWLDWAKNGQSAGTQGLSKRLEAIEIVLVEKGGAAPGPTTKPLALNPSIVYSTHVQDYGWLTPVSGGQMSGTSGKAKRLEAIKVSLKNIPYSGGITYKTHVQDYGWLNAVSNGAISGTLGESKRVEAIQINLTGEMAQHYDIYYRVHAEYYGWLDWAKNGESAGTSRAAKRLEAMEVILVEKGAVAPGSTNRPFIEPSEIITNNYYNVTLNDVLNMQMNVFPLPQTDKYRATPAYVSSQDINLSDQGSINGTSVNLRTSPKLISNSNISENVGNGTSFTILDNNVTGDMFSGSTKWYKINYKGKTLYVHSSFVKRTGTVTSNDPLSIRAEKNTTSHIYGSAKKGTLFTILEEASDWHRIFLGDWRNAKSEDVLEYLDPTKIVNDERKRLQFMNLLKPSEVSKDTLNKYLAGKGKLAGQGQAFIDAGKKHGLNEVYLMSHALLETGHGTSKLSKGIVYNGKTVYNFFGIGANDDCPDDCGAKRAYEEDWDSPEKAIIGGAAFISDKYLRGNNSYKIAQNTLYEMRWNPQLMDTKGVAGHQYATDIGWADKQVAIMYDVYKIQPYTIYLEIPVYK